MHLESDLHEQTLPLERQRHVGGLQDARQATGTRPEVDERTVKLLVGAIAFMLPTLVATLAWPEVLSSISDAYWAGGWAQTTFTGLLFAIAALLCSYDGQQGDERFASRIAAMATLLIALFPCRCSGHAESVKGLHYAAAFALYIVLGFFCWKFRGRALRKGWLHAKRRARVYVACFAGLALAVTMLTLNLLLQQAPANHFPGYVFFWEAMGLLAFSLSWLTASHLIPGLNSAEERFHPLQKRYVAPVATRRDAERVGAETA